MKKRKSKRIPTGTGGKNTYAEKRNRRKRSRPPEKTYTANERRILSALPRIPEGKIASRPLMKLAGISKKADFYDALKSLERSGDVKVDQNHIVTFVSPENDVEATLVSLSAGFGFARADKGELADDFFIHGSDLKGAFVGDRIILTDVHEDEKGFSARVRRIAERAKNPVTGTLHLDKYGDARVKPDGAVRYDLRVQIADLGGAKDGDKVVVKPKADSRGDWRFAKVKSVLGSGESAKVNADAIIQHSGIPFFFSKEQLEEAEIQAELPITDADIAERLDLRDKPIFTIDGADAKDLDDAILVEKTKTGYRLGVHIADVSHYVRAGSLLDDEAFRRGTSVYFADRVIPMLPTDLSNGSCSLNAGTDKLTFSALIDFDTEGEIASYDFRKSIINSKVRGVYSEVNEIFAGSASPEILKKYAPVMAGLKNARKLAKLLKRKTAQRGDMELQSSEIKFVLDENGVCIGLEPRTTGEAEELIEHMMISANICAAKFGQHNRLPFLYRVHGQPRESRLEDLIKLLDILGIPCKEIKSGKPGATDFSAILERVKGTPRESLVSMQVLRTMEKARYAAEETGHFGLVLSDYSHFTSPIRRYPDTSIHRIMSAFLSGESSKAIEKDFGEFAKESAAASSKNEIRAVNAEREAESCYIAEYMKKHIGERFTGVISGAVQRGFFVRLPNGAEGLVSIDDIAYGPYEYDGVFSFRNRAGGRLMVGDEFEIIVAKAEVSTGKVDFIPYENKQG